MKFYKLLFSNVNNELEEEHMIPNAERFNTIGAYVVIINQWNVILTYTYIDCSAEELHQP